MWLGDNKKNSNASSVLDALKGLNQSVYYYFYIVRIGLSRLQINDLRSQNRHRQNIIFGQTKNPKKKDDFKKHINFSSSRIISIRLI